MAFTDPVRIELADHLENPGDSWQVAGTVPVSTYEVGEKEFALDDGLSYDVVFTHTGDGVLLSELIIGMGASIGIAADKSVRRGNLDSAALKNQNVVVFRFGVELERQENGGRPDIGHEPRPRPALDIAVQVGNEVLTALEKRPVLL